MQFNLSYGEIVPLDVKYEKKSLIDDMQHVHSGTSNSMVPNIGMERKVQSLLNSDISISYDCDPSNFQGEGDSFMFSISNSKSSLPLQLDSTPSYSLLRIDRTVHDFHDPASTMRYGTEVLSSNHNDYNEDKGRALVVLPSRQMQLVKNMRKNHAKFVNNSVTDSSRLSSIAFANNENVSDAGQCERPIELFKLLNIDVSTTRTCSTGSADRVSKSEYFMTAALLAALTWSLYFFFAQRSTLPTSPVVNNSGAPACGSLQIFKDKELGRGSNGTVVLQGILEGKRAVAVKKMLSRFQKTVQREMELLSLSDGHANVVRYFQSFQEGDFHLLVLELCEMSLWRYVEAHSGAQSRCQFAISIIDQEIKVALKQIARGISHLHSKNIVHRDVKPHNILLSRRNSSDRAELSCDKQPCIGDFCLKISDMGLSKQLGSQGENSCASFSFSSQSSHDKGTIGWQPRELILQRLKNNMSNMIESQPLDMGAVYKIDIFGLGCVFYYVLSSGHHPFGAVCDRERNILDGNFDISLLESHPDAQDLISRMIDRDPSNRPSASQILDHPFFWSDTCRLDFLGHLSERLQNQYIGQKLQYHMEENRQVVIGEDYWSKFLPTSLLRDLNESHVKYDYSSLSDCLRMMRNKRRHTDQLDRELKALITPDRNFHTFFLVERWPKLLMYCIRLACCYTSAEDFTFEEFFIGSRHFFVNSLRNKGKREVRTPPVSCAIEGVTSFSNDNTIMDIAWAGSSLAAKSACRGWWASTTAGVGSTPYASSIPFGGAKCHARHSKCLRKNIYYRSHLCELMGKCERRYHKKESKRCVFAHDPMELKQRRKHHF